MDENFTRSQSSRRNSGVLAWFASNKVAANLLMAMLILAGVVSMLQMRQEIFPYIASGLITVSVPYPGASPEEVEEGVVMRVEEAIVGIEDIKRIRSTANEGQGIIVAELEDYADQRRVINEIESAVNRIDNFPQDIERPVISEASTRMQVLSVVLSGEVPERSLKQLVERMRDDLTAMDNISQVELSGVRRYEISIEVSEEALRRHSLTLEQLAQLVRQSSLDLPGGSIETEGGEILLRTKGQRYSGQQFNDLIAITDHDGTILRLGQIAEIIDGFEDSDLATYFDGKPAALLKVYRVGDQDALEVAATVRRYVDGQRAGLPSGISVDIWLDRSRVLDERIDLLLRNAYIGLALVFLCLMLFMDPYLSFWTTMGIPISFMGAFFILAYFDITINMISLFAFIVVLGIVVDDAIVVGENIFAYRQRGMEPLQAAIKGVREMAAPVTIAILTSVVAFTPLLFTSGRIGKIIYVIPAVVVAVLILSLVEALLILPAHLSGRSRMRGANFLARLGSRMQASLDCFVQGPYMKTLRCAVKWRYTTIAIGVSMLAITLGFVIGGHIKFVFFDEIDSDNVLAELTMPPGTPVERTREVVDQIERAAVRVRNKLESERGSSPSPLFKHINTTIGGQPFKQMIEGPGAVGVHSGSGNSHIAEVNIELLSSEFRNVASSRVENFWREEVGDVAGASSLVFESSFFSAGEDINVELSHPKFETMLQVMERLKARLRQYRGVSDIEDSFLLGKQQVGLSLKDEGRTLGLTLEDLARQVRNAFYGAEAQRIQRGRDDVRVMIRYPQSERHSLADIETMRLRLSDNTEVPFRVVAKVNKGRGYARIERTDRRRIVKVTASVNENLSDVSADSINKDLFNVVLPKLQQENPGLLFRAEGEQAEQMVSMRSLWMHSILALLGIFALLGVQFRSYIQPLIVMTAIPFGLIGAVVGHVIMGLNLQFLSLFGVVALTGVVVNDSLIMIDLINRRREETSETLFDIVMSSGVRRFRPIFLTTLTTFLGLTPMLLETSLQAKFLIPMAVSLAFGVLFATAITLIFIPTLYMVLEDIRSGVTGLVAVNSEAK